MDFDWYEPCTPVWLCEPFFIVFSTLVIIGVLVFVGLIYREYKRIEHVKMVMRHRRIHHRVRKTMDRPYSKRPYPKKQRPKTSKKTPYW